MMTISKVAEAAGMFVKTVRYYGDIELVVAPQRSPSGTGFMTPAVSAS